MTPEETIRLAELNKRAKKLHWSQHNGPHLPVEPFKPEEAYMVPVKKTLAYGNAGELVITPEVLGLILTAAGKVVVSLDSYDDLVVHDVTQKLTPTPKYKTRMKEYKSQFEKYQKDMASYKEDMALWNEWWKLSVKARAENKLDNQLKEARELIRKVDAAKALLLIHGEKIV